MVERFACPCEPEGWVVQSLVLLVGSPKANWPQGRGQKVLEDLMIELGRSEVILPRGNLGPSFGARPRGRAQQWVPGGWVCHRAWLDTVRRSYKATTPSRRPITDGKNRWGLVHCQKSAGKDRGRWQTAPGQQRLALGHLAGEEGVGACVGGGALPVRSGGAHFHM